MKKNISAIMLFALAAFSSLGILSCKKTFEGVTAILSNNYIKQRVHVQIINANPNASNPYPANTILTLSGTGVEQGLIYSDVGALLTAATGSAKAVSNELTLVVKPYTTIQANAPISFTIKAEAPGYLSTSKDIVITSLDSMQYVDVKMVQIASLPTGVAVANNVPVAPAVSGTISVGDTLKVYIGANTPSNLEAMVIVPSNTILKDVNNTIISTTAPLNITASTYKGISQEAVQILPGGLFDVATTTGENVSFTLGGAIDINATLGNAEVKNFSTPLPAELELPTTAFNEMTNTTIKAGDQIEIWSNSGGDWKYEGMATITPRAIGGLKVNFNITHLSTWMAGYRSNMCASDLKINFTSPGSATTNIYYLTVSATAADGGQTLVNQALSLTDGDIIQLSLPTGMDYTVKLYSGSFATGSPIASLVVPGCATTATINYVAPITNPELKFDLITKCSDGIFRYDGAIDYKLNGTPLWSRFSPSVKGTLSTSLLEWNKTYDFRIIYNGAALQRTRQVLQSEFRNVSGNLWNYWGRNSASQQTFFSTPSSCN